MKIIDISWPISSDMTAYKDEKVVEYTAIKSIEKDGTQKTRIVLDSHTGTHVDAPSHLHKDGLQSHQQELDKIIGNAVVLDMMHIEEVITAADLQEYDLEGCDIVLFKTVNSQRKATDAFDKHYVYVDASAALYLAEIGVHAVGIDYVGIERNSTNHEVHSILMKAGIAIIEGLRLAAVQEDAYFFVCLPLPLVGLDGAPARAILVSDLQDNQDDSE